MIQQGALGSMVLPQGAPGATWQVGSTVEVQWGLRFNHGGGYQYRLCPASEALTEDCFQRNPMRFVRGAQALQWGNGTRMEIPSAVQQYVNEGVIPVGYDWVMNPIPVISGQHAGCFNTTNASATDHNGMICRQFKPPCREDDGWGPTPGSRDPQDVMGKCSNNWIAGTIVDRVVVPAGLEPGAYVLGFRWDAEQTSQVWSSCADIRIVDN